MTQQTNQTEKPISYQGHYAKGRYLHLVFFNHFDALEHAKNIRADFKKSNVSISVRTIKNKRVGSSDIVMLLDELVKASMDLPIPEGE